MLYYRIFFYFGVALQLVATIWLSFAGAECYNEVCGIGLYGAIKCCEYLSRDCFMSRILLVRTCGGRFVRFVISYRILGFNSFIAGDKEGAPFFMGANFCEANTRLHHLNRCCTRTIGDGFNLSFSILFKPTCGNVPLSITTAVTVDRGCNRSVHCYSGEGRIGSRNSGNVLLNDPVGSNSEIIVVRSIAATNASVRRALPVVGTRNSMGPVNLIISISHVRHNGNAGDTLSRVRRGCNLGAATVMAVTRIIRRLCGGRCGNGIVVSSGLGTTVSTCCRRCNIGRWRLLVVGVGRSKQFCPPPGFRGACFTIKVV